MIDRTNELPRNGAVRLPPLLFRKKHLSHLLIFILLILSPLTFSNNNIPNFTYECGSTLSLRSKAEAALAIVRTIRKPVPQRETVYPDTVAYIPSLLHHPA